MPNAVVMSGYGPPGVLKWARVPLPEPGEGQIRIKVKAAGVGPTDLALRAGYLKDIPLPPDAVLGFEGSRYRRRGRARCHGHVRRRRRSAAPAVQPGRLRRVRGGLYLGPQAGVRVVDRCRRAAQLGRGGRRCSAAAERRQR